MEYAMLMNPGHNRVYFEEAKRLAAAELQVLAGAMACAPREITHRQIAGVDYLAFAAGAPPGEADLAVLGRASFAFALYQVQPGAGGTLLAPVALPGGGAFAGIGGMLKYRGKTNELFTRMMINLAQYSGAFAGLEAPCLLDPMAGKGTTLFEAAALGLDACGVEIAAGTVGEAATFFQKYLERGRFKHTRQDERVGTPQGRAQRSRFQYATDKADFKAGHTRTLEMVAGDSRNTGLYYKKSRFHLLVADLPYGVQHGNVAGEKLSRDPAALLQACLPAWHTVLKAGAAAAVSWNTLVLPRQQVAQLFTAAGFKVKQGPPYEGLAHRVEQAINRDVLVAVKL